MLKLFPLLLLIAMSSAFAEDGSLVAVTLEQGALLHQSQNAYSQTDKRIGDEYAYVRNHEGIADQFSAVIEPDIHAGADWYGVLGLLERTHLKEECWIVRLGKEGCAATPLVSQNQGRFQMYVGGGMRYRVRLAQKWTGVSMLGITYTHGESPEQFPRRHLYHAGLRLEYAIARSLAGTLGYHHLSNGYQLHLPGGQPPNSGVDRLSLGLQYRF